MFHNHNSYRYMKAQLVYDETELIARLKEGDEIVFERIYAQYSQRLLDALIKLVCQKI